MMAIDDSIMETQRQSCAECLTDELKPENVAPMHENTRLFIDSQWSTGRLSCGYVVYRAVVACLMIAWVIADLISESSQWFSDNYAIWFVFATNWSFASLCICSVMMAISSTFYYFRMRRLGTELPKPIGWGLRVQWIVYNIASNSSLVVSISYWSFILIFVDNDLADFMTTQMTQLKHSLNTIYVIVDLFVNATPIRIYHLIYPLFTALIYSIFNAVYFVNDGVGPNGHPYAYDVMDWRNPFGSTVTCLLAFVISCCVQFVLYGLYLVRIAAFRRMNAVLSVEATVGGYRTPDIFVDEASCSETGPIFPNGLDRGSGGAHGLANVGYNSIGSVINVEMNAN